MNQIQEFNIVAPASATGKKLNLLTFHKSDNFAWKNVRIRSDGKQPMLMKIGNGKAARKFQAFKEDGVSDNAGFYVFTKTKNQFEVQPVTEWYKCRATQRFKPLSVEQAENLFAERDKILNHSSVMPQRSGDNTDDGVGKRTSFKVSELDDSDMNDSDHDDSDGDAGDSKAKLKAKLKKKRGKYQKEEKDKESEAGEESDEGDFDDREVDYMSDSSSSDESEADEKDDKTDVKAISEETGLRDLLCSDDEDDKGEAGSDSLSDEHTMAGANVDRGTQIKKSESDLSGLDSDSDGLDETEPPIKPNLKRKYPGDDDGATSSSATNPPVRRPHMTEVAGQDAMYEEIITKYLKRKPITVKQLIKAVKKQLEKDQKDFDGIDLEKMGLILRRLKPEQTKGQSEQYLYLKHDRPM